MIDGKKVIAYGVVAMALITALVMGLSYLTSTHSVSVSFRDASDVTISKHSDGKTQQVATIKKSGDSVRLSNDGDYQATYSGAPGFASGSTTVGKSDKAISITPDFSSDKYKEMTSSLLPIVHEIISKRYPKTDSLYAVEVAGIKDRGRWLVAKLVFKGEYSYTSDSLKVLVENINGSWQIRTKPDIILTQAAYPSLPVDILSWADKL